jgi:hypothetical protein
MTTEKKPQMAFRATLSNGESIIQAACPQSHAWFESMGKHHISPTDLHWVGKMGIDIVMVTGKIREAQKVLGDKLSHKGVLTTKFDAKDVLKVQK